MRDTSLARFERFPNLSMVSSWTILVLLFHRGIAFTSASTGSGHISFLGQQQRGGSAQSAAAVDVESVPTAGNDTFSATASAALTRNDTCMFDAGEIQSGVVSLVSCVRREGHPGFWMDPR